MENYIVYMHKNKINNKVYIGMTKDVINRWKSNGIKYKPKKGKENSRPFWNAIKKYGFESFEHIILEENLSKEEACEKEKYYIQKFKSREREKGYNIAEGGNGGRIYLEHPKGMLGKQHNNEWKQKHSNDIKKAAERGAYKDVWKKNKHPRGMLGKHHSEEFKEKLRNIPPEKQPNAKKTIVIYPNGTQKIYGCMKQMCKDNGISVGLGIRIIQSNKPYIISKQCFSNLENLKKIEGCIIKYLEDTEESGQLTNIQ